MRNNVGYAPVGNSKKPGFNYQMCILSVIGIIFVMLGHLKTDMTSLGTFYGWFPYYSFHMPLFLFISGYFYKESNEQGFPVSFLKFLKKKVLSLLVPFYVINGIFLLLQTLLVNYGYYLGETFSLKVWLLHPWIYPEPPTLAHPTWFLMALFLAEIYYILFRKLIRIIVRKDIAAEIVITILSLLLSMAAIYCKYTADPSPTAVLYLRSVFIMFFLQAGHMYKKYLEKIDNIPNKILLPVLFIIQLAIILYTENSPLYYSLVTLNWYGRVGIVSIIASLSGIAFWLRISRILASIPARSRLVMFIGDNTKYIMSFHLFVYFLVNLAFNHLRSIPGAGYYLSAFDEEKFRTSVYYVCNDNPRTILIYFAAGMAVSLLAAKVISLVKSGIRHGR